MLYDKLTNYLTDKQKSYANWQSNRVKEVIDYIEATLINGRTDISLPHLAKEYKEEVLKLSFLLSKIGMIESRVFNNYAVWHMQEQFIQKLIPDYNEWLFEARVNKYMPRLNNRITPTNLTKTHSGIKSVGIVRRGFGHAAKCKYSYDTQMMNKYYDIIERNVLKGLKKQHEKGKLTSNFWSNESNYANIVKEVLHRILTLGDIEEYNLESFVSDSRGRVIYNGLKRIFNPVSNKFARSLLVVKPKTITLEDTVALNDIFYFIAELNGIKGARNEAVKTMKGVGCYNKRNLPDVDEDDMFEQIWLERIYSKLDELYTNGTTKWDIPLEVDMTASMIQIDAIFLNDINLMKATNLVINQKEGLQDIWTINGASRKAVKAVMTPTLYGSSESFKNLLKHRDIEVSDSELKALKRAAKDGLFKPAVLFKEAIIKSSNVQTPKFTVDFGDEQFEVEVNRLKELGKKPVTTTAYDSKKNTVRVAITHEPVVTPDFDRFKTYMKTLFTHNRDSAVSNYVSEKFKEGDKWLITIHDAVLALPGDCKLARELTVEKMEEFRNNRVEIINKFRKSIGATGHKADVAMMKTYKAVTKPNKEVKLDIACMK